MREAAGKVKRDEGRRPAFLREAPRWLNYRTIAVAWAGLLVYGSLLPFRFHWGTVYEQAEGWLGAVWLVATSPAWRLPHPASGGFIGSAWAVDLMINLLLYGPLGIAIRLDLRRRGRSPRAQLLIAAACLAGISYLLECVQSLELSRVASLVDVLTNTAGGTLAAALGIHIKHGFDRATLACFRMTRRFTDGRSRQPGMLNHRGAWWLGMLGVDVALVIAWTGYTTQWTRVPTGRGLPFEHLFNRPYDVAAVQLGQMAAVYALLAVLLSLQLLQMGWRRRKMWLLAAVSCVAVLREVVHAWRMQERFDVTEVLVALLAAGVVMAAAHAGMHVVRCSSRRQSEPVARDRRPTAAILPTQAL